MQGTDSTRGAPLSGRAHIAQSIRDILTTPIGTRVARRSYGSRLHSLIDEAITKDLALDFYAAAADAIHRWEPRVRVDLVKMIDAQPGRAVIDVQVTELDSGEPIRIPEIVIE